MIVPLAVPVQFATGTAVGLGAIDQRVRDAATGSALDGLAAPRPDVAAHVQAAIDAKIDEFRDVVVDEVTRTLDEQERKIEHDLVLSKQDDAVKAEELRRAEGILVTVRAQRLALAGARNKALQG